MFPFVNTEHAIFIGNWVFGVSLKMLLLIS